MSLVQYAVSLLVPPVAVTKAWKAGLWIALPLLSVAPA
jgi:hypothetical protein